MSCFRRNIKTKYGAFALSTLNLDLAVVATQDFLQDINLSQITLYADFVRFQLDRTAGIIFFYPLC